MMPSASAGEQPLLMISARVRYSQVSSIFNSRILRSEISKESIAKSQLCLM